MSTIVNNVTLVDVAIEIKRRVREIQQTLKQRTLQEIKNRQNDIEFMS